MLLLTFLAALMDGGWPNNLPKPRSSLVEGDDQPYHPDSQTFTECWHACAA